MKTLSRLALLASLCCSAVAAAGEPYLMQAVAEGGRLRLLVIDQRSQTLLVYEVTPALKLVAARSLRHDGKIRELNDRTARPLRVGQLAERFAAEQARRDAVVEERKRAEAAWAAAALERATALAARGEALRVRQAADKALALAEIERANAERALAEARQQKRAPGRLRDRLGERVRGWLRRRLERRR